MKSLNALFDRIVQGVNINLRELDFDVHPLVKDLIPAHKMTEFYAFYGISPHHPLSFQFKRSNLSGSYFLGKCQVTNSLLYKSDIRGDELKKKGTVFRYKNFEIPVEKDEEIKIDDSFLIKTLVHNNSHDPESLEKFFIRHTISTHYANIHGSPMDGCFLEPFSTVDLTTMQDCLIGAFSYVQADEVRHMEIEPGTVWVRSPGDFNFLYSHPKEKLQNYIFFKAGSLPQGIFIDFVEDRKEAFRKLFAVVDIETPVSVPATTSLDRYAVIKPKTHVGQNVLVSQRAYLQNSKLGKGSNAQESCYIINSKLEGFDITAHGAKIIEADLGKNIFVGFNSFLRGRPNSRITIGEGNIVMPHTIIDTNTPLSIPPNRLVWGLITSENDLQNNSLPIEILSKVKTTISKGDMVFEGNGSAFVSAFKERIHHILEENGAFFSGTKHKGHAQRNQNISFNTIQPYPKGEKEGLYPTIIIQP